MKARQKNKQKHKFESIFAFDAELQLYKDFKPIPQKLFDEMREILKLAEESIAKGL